AYAHVLTRYAGPRASVVIHLAVMIAAAFALPLSIPTGWDRPPAAAEALWLMGLFTASIGLPFFALAANSPLLQAWLPAAHHPPRGESPSFPLCARQCGTLLRAVTLSDRERAFRRGRGPSMSGVDRFLLAHCTARRLRGAAVACAVRKCACRRPCRAPAE